MAKVIQLNRNGELSEFCRSRRRSDRGETDPAPAQHREVVSKTRVSDWVEMSVPALSGPHNSRPWAHSLRNLVQPPHRLNWYRLGLRVTGFELFVDKEVEVKEVGIRSSVLSAVRSWYPCPDSNRGTRFRKPALYPPELQGHDIDARRAGAIWILTVPVTCFQSPTVRLRRRGARTRRCEGRALSRSGCSEPG